MPFDGVFIHFLTKELNSILSGKKINRIIQPNMLDIVLQFKIKDEDGNNTQSQLLISSSLDMPRIYLTKEKFTSLDTPKSFCTILRKCIERGIINKVSQVGNDRIIVFDINSFSELGDPLNFKLVFELMGRNSNLILINSDNKIVDVMRKLPPTIESSRLIIPHSYYEFPLRENAINPFTKEVHDEFDFSNLEGCSKLMLNECHDSKDLINYINQPIKPFIFSYDKKTDFYLLPLTNKTIVKDDFKNINEMLDTFYLEHRTIYNDKAKSLKKVVKNKIVHLTTKLENLKISLENAYENLNCQHLGLLLQANLYKVKKGDEAVIVEDFTKNYEEVIINLDTNLDPSKNLKRLFLKGKKAQNAISQSNIQIDLTNKEIRYLDTILTQIDFASPQELDEIKDELIKEKYLKEKKNNIKHKKTQVTKYYLDDIEIVVGKNNIQNNYITHQLSNSYDWWFHVKDLPGSHVLLRSPNPNYQLSEKQIRFCANLASKFSKASKSSSVPVDYTLIKYIKKIPGLKGCEVTYTNQKTIYIDPE